LESIAVLVGIEVIVKLRERFDALRNGAAIHIGQYLGFGGDNRGFEGRAFRCEGSLPFRALGTRRV
jgi:hypothetical protein